MAKTPTDKQCAYIGKKKAQNNEKYLQEEWLRKKNRLLSMNRHATTCETWVQRKNKYVTASTLELDSLGEGGHSGECSEPPLPPPQQVQGRAMVGGPGGKAPEKFGILDP